MFLNLWEIFQIENMYREYSGKHLRATQNFKTFSLFPYVLQIFFKIKN